MSILLNVYTLHISLSNGLQWQILAAEAASFGSAEFLPECALAH
jgi:hypothetical protein